MSLRIEDYVSTLRNDKVEREIASKVMKMLEVDRLHFILDTITCGLPHTFSVGLWLAKTCLKDRSSLEAILSQGLDRGDASTVKYWIDSTVSGLGFRRVIRLLTERISHDPDSVVKAEYWLRQCVPVDNKRDAEAFAVLQTIIKQIMIDDPSIESRVRPMKSLMKKNV